MILFVAIINLINLFSNTIEEANPIATQPYTFAIHFVTTINKGQNPMDLPFEIEAKDEFKKNVTDEFRTSKKKKLPHLLKNNLKGIFDTPSILNPIEFALHEKHRLNLFQIYQHSLSLFESFLL